jgi:hypothetical protein
MLSRAKSPGDTRTNELLGPRKRSVAADALGGIENPCASLPTVQALVLAAPISNQCYGRTSLASNPTLPVAGLRGAACFVTLTCGSRDLPSRPNGWGRRGQRLWAELENDGGEKNFAIAAARHMAERRLTNPSPSRADIPGVWRIDKGLRPSGARTPSRYAQPFSHVIFNGPFLSACNPS